uniref:F-box domain-containing protein n=1 Tax=Neogobius melanostomus TaxID=47308 RepID=A0A8C6WUJ1_9GOBI
MSSNCPLCRLPSEILIKILSYLDAAALFTLSHVSSLLYQLASDNALWHKIFLKEFGCRRKQNHKCIEDLVRKTTDVRDLNIGHWKWLYFKTVADCDMFKWKKHLRVVNPHTGLPSKTEQRVLEESRSFCSVTLCWSGGFPDLQHMSALQLFGVRRIALSCTGLKHSGHVGQDRLVELKLLQPGVIVGIWKDQCAVAFVMFCLHFHKLLERSTQGSSVCHFVEPVGKPRVDDIDPEYGLHGYFLHIALHNSKCRIMSESFSKLFCRKSELCDGLMQLTAISRNRLSAHTPLSGSIAFPWRCEALCGTVQDCCFMTLTLLDEFNLPVWCVSSAVCLKADESGYTDYNYEGDYFLIHYTDEDGQVKINLVHDGEQQIHTVVGLVVYIATSKINSHFGTNY